MSPELPIRPSLEHLRKQARERLRELRVRVPDAQLADVQHALAREYGFASWPRLKAHIEALTAGPSSPDYRFDRYSERAKRAAFFSRWEAGQLGSATIRCEHLLLGVVQARQDLKRSSPFAPPLADLRAAVARRSTVMPALPHSVMLPFSDATKAVLARAVETAASLGHAQISTGHLLMALVPSAPSLAASILAQHQVSERSLRRDADAFLADG